LLLHHRSVIRELNRAYFGLVFILRVEFVQLVIGLGSYAHVVYPVHICLYQGFVERFDSEFGVGSGERLDFLHEVYIVKFIFSRLQKFGRRLGVGKPVDFGGIHCVFGCIGFVRSRGKALPFSRLPTGSIGVVIVLLRGLVGVFEF